MINVEIPVDFFKKEIKYTNAKTLESATFRVSIDKLLYFFPKIIQKHQINDTPITITGNHDVQIYTIIFDICNSTKINISFDQLLNLSEFAINNDCSDSFIDILEFIAINSKNINTCIKLLNIEFANQRNNNKSSKLIQYINTNSKEISIDQVIDLPIPFLSYFFDKINFKFAFVKEFLENFKGESFRIPFHIIDIDEQKQNTLISLISKSMIFSKIENINSVKKTKQSIAKPPDYTPDIFDAIRRGSCDCVKYILQEEPESISKIDAVGDTLLHYAVKYHYIDIVSLLLDNGIKINTQNNSGYTALNLCASSMDVNIMSLLLNKGGDPNIYGNGGWSCLHEAAMLSTPAMVKLLLQHGAKTDKKDKDGSAPIDVAVDDEIIEILQQFSS